MVQSVVDPELVELMPDQVTIERRLGVDRYNTPTYGPIQTYQARIEHHTRHVIDRDGREVLSAARTILAVPDEIQSTDRITFPDGSTPTIITLDISPDERGRFNVSIMT